MRDENLTAVLAGAVDDGLVAAALVDRNGHTIALAGAIDEDEAMPLAALVMYRLKSGDLAARLFSGEIITLVLDDREVAVAVAKRQLFVVVVLGSASSAAALDRVQELHDDVERMLANDAAPSPPWRVSGGSGGSGPADLPLIEFGITVGRRGKA